MADLTITAPAVPLKLFLVRIVQKDETGNIEECLFKDDVLAITEDAAKAVALLKVRSTVDDPSRLAFSVGAITI